MSNTVEERDKTAEDWLKSVSSCHATNSEIRSGMSTWEKRGFQCRVRLNLGGDLLEWNGCYLDSIKNSLEALTDVIQKQRPDLPRETIHKAVRAWHTAMYDPDEGKAVHD